MATYRETLTALSPTHYWPLDEASGTTADDAIGTADGTYMGSPLPTLNVAPLIAEGAAVQFTRANNNRVEVLDDPDWDGFTSMSLVLAVKYTTLPSGVTYGLVARSAFTTAGAQWRFAHGEFFGHTLFFKHNLTGGGGELSSSVAWSPATSTRYLLGMVWTGSVIRIYVNGAQQGTDQATTGTMASGGTLPLKIAVNNDSNADPFNGVIDEVAYWKNTALTTQNMSDLYAAIDNVNSAATLKNIGSEIWPVLASAPTTATGQAYYNSTTNQFMGYNGTDWIVLS